MVRSAFSYSSVTLQVADIKSQVSGNAGGFSSTPKDVIAAKLRWDAIFLYVSELVVHLWTAPILIKMIQST